MRAVAERTAWGGEVSSSTPNLAGRRSRARAFDAAGSATATRPSTPHATKHLPIAVSNHAYGVGADSSLLRRRIIDHEVQGRK